MRWSQTKGILFTSKLVSDTFYSDREGWEFNLFEQDKKRYYIEPGLTSPKPFFDFNEGLWDKRYLNSKIIFFSRPDHNEPHNAAIDSEIRVRLERQKNLTLTDRHEKTSIVNCEERSRIALVVIG